MNNISHVHSEQTERVMDTKCGWQHPVLSLDRKNSLKMKEVAHKFTQPAKVSDHNTGSLAT